MPKDEISGLVIGGSGEIGVDSYIIHRSSNTVIIIQSKWHITDGKEASTLITHLTGCMAVLGDYDTTNEISTNQLRIQLDREIMEIAEALDQKSDLIVKIILISNWDAKETTETLSKRKIALGKEVDSKPEYGYADNIEHWGPEEIEKQYRIEAGKAIKPVVNSDREIAGDFLIADTDKDLMIGYINGANLKEFMKNSNGTKDLKLLSANVRMRKATGSNCTASSTDPAERIAFRIRECLLNESKRFARRNNGLQIVVDDYKFLDTHDESSPHYSGKVQLINPSLSNGGQTAQEVFDCSEKELSDVRIVVKIIKCQDSTERTENAISSNQQNATTPRNFRANDDDMQLLSKHFANLDPKLFLEIKENEWKNRLSNDEDMNAQFPGGKIDNTFTGQLIWAWYGGWGFPSSKKENQWHGELTHDLYDLNVDEVKDSSSFPVGQKTGNQAGLNIKSKSKNYSTVAILTRLLFNIFNEVKNKRMKKANLWDTGVTDREKVTEKNLFVTSGSFAFIGLVNYVRVKLGCTEKEILETLLGKGFQGKDWGKWIIDGGSNKYSDIVGPLNTDKGNHKLIKRDHVPTNNEFLNAQKWVSSLYDCMFTAAATWRRSNDQSSANLYYSNNYSGFITECTNEIDKIFDDGKKDQAFPLKSTASKISSIKPSMVTEKAATGVDDFSQDAVQAIRTWIKGVEKGKTDKVVSWIKKDIEKLESAKKTNPGLYQNLEQALDLEDIVLSEIISELQSNEADSGIKEPLRKTEFDSTTEEILVSSENKEETKTTIGKNENSLTFLDPDYNLE
ncbi:MAG: AIPR family protein [Candidatus Poseidoniaceae archaeon]